MSVFSGHQSQGRLWFPWRTQGHLSKVIIWEAIYTEGRLTQHNMHVGNDCYVPLYITNIAWLRIWAVYIYPKYCNSR